MPKEEYIYLSFSNRKRNCPLGGDYLEFCSGLLAKALKQAICNKQK